jgi:hypothetical protein
MKPVERKCNVLAGFEQWEYRGVYRSTAKLDLLQNFDIRKFTPRQKTRYPDRDAPIGGV